MVNPLSALNAFQRDIDKGEVPLEVCQFDDQYQYVLDVVNDKNRFSCFKLKQGAISAYVGLVNVGDELGVQQFQIGYSVIEKERGKGLGAAIINTSISELQMIMHGYGIDIICIEAVVGLKNIHSISLAKKCINHEYAQIVDEFSGEDALYFKTIRSYGN